MTATIETGPSGGHAGPDRKRHRATARVLAVGRAGGLACLLALGLAACNKGPDRAVVAGQIKGDVEAQLQTVENGSAQKVLSHSAVTVTPGDGDTYLVAIEGLKFQPDPEGYLDIGTISYVAKPKDEKSYEVSDLKIAPEIPFKGADGKEEGKLSLTTKAFSGLWSRELNAFQKLDGEFTDIAATDNKGADLRFAGIKFNGELADKGGGMFDTIGTVTLNGLTVKETASGGGFAIAETRVDGKYDDLKVKEYQAAAKTYQELMGKHLAAVEAAAKSGGQPPAFTAEEQQAVTQAVTAMAATVKGGDFKIGLKGISYSEGGATPFALEQLNFGSSFDGINQEKASIGLDISHQGLAINTPDASGPLAKGVLPKSGNLGIKVTEIPSKDLIKVLADNLPGMLSPDGAMAEANAMAMLVALQAVLQTSGAKIEVTPSGLTAEATQLKAGGAFNVTPQSIYGVVGALDLALTGLDDVMALAQANPNEPDAQEVMSTVGMLMQYAQREQGADGKPVDKFKIEVKETGEMLVNGKPM